MFVFDTETRVDATQRLTFGSFRFIVGGRCVEEALFYGDDLPEGDRQVLERYVRKHPNVLLLSRCAFLEKLYSAAYKGRCLVVGFNLPFDLSRLAHDVAPARGRFAGGFSLGLWSYRDEEGEELANHYRPRIGIKHIDSKRSLIGFTSRNKPDRTDLIPEGSPLGKPEPGYIFRGHFLDLRTLAFALTDRGYSLEQACKTFGVEHGKHKVDRHGVVTEQYIDYNRRDVLATAELAVKLLEEYDKHSVALQVTKAYSPASIGKAYLRAMGIKPVMDRQPNFPAEYIGFAQTAFFGGRTSAHIRKIAVPVVYTDFLSMYPTVNSLMGLWRFVICERIDVVEHCQSEIKEFLARLAPDDLFSPAVWPKLTAFVKIVPDGDLLPSRCKYNSASNDWQVAVNHIYAGTSDADKMLWVSLPDLAASVIRTGRIPTIVEAFRIEARGTQDGLRSTKLRGAIEVDPRIQDLFKVVIEERKRLSKRSDLSPLEKERLDKALKVLANAASYGIYAEMNRQESDERVNVVCHGIDPEAYTCSVQHPDVPGEFCFPPLASLITGAARLMLALLEHKVSELGGTYAMEDTDSMAIVATKRGGLVPCSGGDYRMKNGSKAVKALSWKQVAEIGDHFSSLNPYERDAVPGSILKIESDNFDTQSGTQRPIYCLAISAKRYSLFLMDKNGTPQLLRKDHNNGGDRWSEHGLGHLLNPTDPESVDREWIAQAWLRIIRTALGLRTTKHDFGNLPAVGRVSVSSPGRLRPLLTLNENRPYAQQLKPFNFLLTCHVKHFGHPIGADPEHFHLVAPYQPDARRWLEMKWIDQYTGNRYWATTEGHHVNRTTARLKTYEEILREYEFHQESKCADSQGKPCDKQTIGLLRRRHVLIDQIRYVGKESNSLEDVESGLMHSEQSVYTEYPDPRRDEWQKRILPALKKIPLSKLAETGLSRRMLIDARTGRRVPHRRNQETLAAIVHEVLL